MIFIYYHTKRKMHKEFAEIYDVFMKHVDYNDWYKFLKNYIKKKGSILDLGCGTGEFIHRFLKDGYDITGVDISDKMIKVTNEKIKSKNLKNNTKIQQNFTICN